MKYLTWAWSKLAFFFILAVVISVFSTRGIAGEHDPDVTDDHRVEVLKDDSNSNTETDGEKIKIEEHAPSQEEGTTEDIETKFMLYDTLQALLAHSSENTPLRDSITKLLTDMPRASNEEIYKKVQKLLTGFDGEKDTGLYRAIAGILRQFKPVFYATSFMPCAVTPTLKPSFLPMNPIVKHGNLLRKEGEARRALGQYIRIVGRVLDESCLPVENAVIEIWQPDHTGKNENDYIPASSWDRKDPDYDPYFAYSGTAQTNNLGEFSFLTIFPGVHDTQNPKEQEAPHINVRVTHPTFQKLTTRLYFVNHPRNEHDATLQSLDANKKIGRKDVRDLVVMEGKALDPTHKYEGRIYRKTLVLRGIDPYRQY